MRELFTIAGCIFGLMLINDSRATMQPVTDFLNWIEVNHYDQYLSYESYKEHNP